MTTMSMNMTGEDMEVTGRAGYRIVRGALGVAYFVHGPGNFELRVGRVLVASTFDEAEQLITGEIARDRRRRIEDGGWMS